MRTRTLLPHLHATLGRDRQSAAKVIDLFGVKAAQVGGDCLQILTTCPLSCVAKPVPICEEGGKVEQKCATGEIARWRDDSGHCSIDAGRF
jgi:hypothetical protein